MAVTAVIVTAKRKHMYDCMVDSYYKDLMHKS